jgi:hypothetical protein
MPGYISVVSFAARRGEDTLSSLGADAAMHPVATRDAAGDADTLARANGRRIWATRVRDAMLDVV